MRELPIWIRAWLAVSVHATTAWFERTAVDTRLPAAAVIVFEGFWPRRVRLQWVVAPASRSALKIRLLQS
jgi:hypothetical protein